MTPVRKALWRIERDMAQPLSLADLAEAAGVSRHHLARAFLAVVGAPPMRHLRRRRLTVTAQRLAQGEADILGLALDVGYGSHEAFTRAFRDAFGLTPEAARAAGGVDPTLQEPPIMLDQPPAAPPAPRILDHPAFTVAGLADVYTLERIPEISALWSRFGPHIGRIDGQRGFTAYGVMTQAQEEAGRFTYLASVEIDPDARPRGLRTLAIPARRYAVFTHDGHIADLPKLFTAIYDVWAPQTDLRLAKAPEFERYDHRFDPAAARGVVDIYVPLAD